VGNGLFTTQFILRIKIFKLEIDLDEAKIVRLIFHWYTTGEKGVPLTIGGSQKKLNDMAVPTASNTDHRLVARKQAGNKWYRSVINSILQSETYIGTWRFGKRNKEKGSIS
jgi:hypothetical protein